MAPRPRRAAGGGSQTVTRPLLLACALSISAQIQFEDVTAAAKIEFALRNGAAGRFHLIELMPGGVAAFDYNNDGCQDIYFTNGASVPDLAKTGPPYLNRLFRNRCDGTFEDVTEKAKAGGVGYSMAVAAADYDNDGFVDLFIAGVNRNQLLRNRGDGAFEDATARAGLSGVDPKLGKMWAISAGWFDADNDGWLDLFVSNYVGWNPETEKRCGSEKTQFYCHPDNYTGRPHQLFRNRMDGTFEDISVRSGIAENTGKGMGVAFGDFNRDGKTDVFVANDSVRNFLFENLGGGKFREVGLEYGVSYGENGRAIAGMGADFRDYDNDGLPDIAVTGMINDSYLLFKNTGKGFYFEDATIPSGFMSATRQLTGWGMGFFDLDNDGWKDVFFANSHFPQLDRYIGAPSPLPSTILRNLRNGTFQDVSKQAGSSIQTAAFWRGAAFADFDGDGRVDVVVSAMNAPARLFRNISDKSGHWVAFRLKGKRSNRDGLGAELHLTLPDGRRLMNHATTSVGYASSSEKLVRFGLEEHSYAALVEVRWPSGTRQTLRRVMSDRIVNVEEPER
ncbi:MAG: CRTAC1 family protein [Bryobacteraceae bacterium]